MKYDIKKCVILDFIDGFKKENEEQIVKLFTDGGYSYYFATILDERFSKAGTIMYNPSNKYFYYKLFGKIYNIIGEIEDKEVINDIILWSLYEMKYNNEAMKIVQEDIFKLLEIEE